MSFAALAGIFSVFSFGMIVAFLGSIKLQLAPRIEADNAQFGKIVAAFQWMMVVMAIISGIAIDNFGHRSIIIVGAILAALAIFLIGRGQRIGGIVAVCIPLGIGAQFLNLGGNTLIPNLFADPSAGSNLGNAFFGLGALLVSIITAYLFQKTDFSRALTVVAAIALIPMVFALGGEFPALEKTFSLGIALSLLGNYITWVAALTLFCYIGLEVSLAVWITTYAAELGATETRASRTLSVFLVAIMLSRLVFGLQDRATGVDLTPIGGYVLAGVAIIAAVSITVMMSTRSLRVARGAVFVAGFAFGPIFPTTVGMTFQHFSPSEWGTLFGVIFAVGLIGASIIPAWIGNLAKDKSVQFGFNILRSTAIALAVIAFVLGIVP